ncbi:MAG: type VI secretion system baseplate subunit TssF [Pseudomonadota bacterium]
MADRFLRHYAEELSALRERAGRFAAAHPKLAGRLRLSPDTSDDPHVERLLQGVAFIGARVRQKLDDELPELTDGILETLYPHHLAPIPAMTLVAIEPAPSLAGIETIPRHAPLLTEPVDGEACEFRTTRDVALAPIRLSEARLESQPLDAPGFPGESAACLALRVEPSAGAAGVSVSSLSVAIRAPWRRALAIHELVHNTVLGVAVARHADDRGAVHLPASALSAIGFARDEAMLPFTPASSPGYRVLTEFFALPDAFLGFEIGGLSHPPGEAFTVYIFLSEARPALEREVGAETFALHVTPCVNLFAQRAEPIAVDGIRLSHPIVPDARRSASREVYSVERVGFADETGRPMIAEPFFATKAGTSADVMWQHSRTTGVDGTSDSALALVDGGGRPLVRRRGVATADCLCLNRDLPARLPFGAGHPVMTLSKHGDAVAKVTCLTPPTPTLRLGDEEGRRWQLLSHLSLNHLSLGDDDGAALRSILRLYSVRATSETRLMVDAIRKVATAPGTARMPGGAIVSGTDVAVTFSPGEIDRAGAYVIASVLDRFLGLYTSINSFTRLTAWLADEAQPFAAFPPRAAERPLL